MYLRKQMLLICFSWFPEGIVNMEYSGPQFHVTHNLLHPADLKCYTARAEIKEYRNDSPHSTPTFPKLDRNILFLTLQDLIFQL